MENPKLKDLVINIDDTPIKEEPPKPKKVKASRPMQPSKVKVDKEQGLKLLAQITNSMPWILTVFCHYISFMEKQCNQILQRFLEKISAT